VRLYSFEVSGIHHIGVEHDGRLVDIHAPDWISYAAEPGAFSPSGSVIRSDMLSLLRAGESAMGAVRRLAASLSAGSGSASGDRSSYGFDEVRLLAPVPRPGKILCSGVNYRGHLEENPAAKLPEFPFFFSKLPSAVIGPGQAIVHPAMTRQLDYEVELAVVIGRVMRRVSEAAAMNGVAGYTILHDVSARDVQFTDQQITLGKNFDTFAPMGPSLVTPDELPDPGNVRLRTLVHGRILQDDTTADWVFPLPRLLSFLSSVMTLEPGDVVSTGTPAGVGYFRNPQVFLQPGDTVTLEVEGIGQLENPVIGDDLMG
jgi:2,4-diketo-3-deoxy-L-fuconate hydrolase